MVADGGARRVRGRLLHDTAAEMRRSQTGEGIKRGDWRGERRESGRGEEGGKEGGEGMKGVEV